MIERPIFFSAPMVRALLAGTKTQTRRIVRIDDRPITKADWDAGKRQRGIPSDAVNVRMLGYLKCDAPPGSHAVSSRVDCPYWDPGEGRLWVRETWRTVESLDDVRPCALAERVPVHFEADGANRGRFREPVGKVRQSIFMPRWASRITLEITDVRVQRLQDITDGDAKAEGAKPLVTIGKVYPSKYAADVERESYRDGFADLWRSINGAESWAANQFVWAITFRRVT